MNRNHMTCNLPAGSLRRTARPNSLPVEPWRRGVTRLEIVALLIIAILLVAGPLLSRTVTPRGVHTAALRVDQGDSLWTIAASHPVAGLTTFQTTVLIADSNHLGSGRIAAGSVLMVPANTDERAVASR